MSVELGNTVAREGLDRCLCGSKYWEHDRCVDCDMTIQQVLRERARAEREGFEV